LGCDRLKPFTGKGFKRRGEIKTPISGEIGGKNVDGNSKRVFFLALSPDQEME
jgi:hypothetical protein